MKKAASVFFIALIAVTIGGVLSYVRASYVEPAGAPNANNVPVPILLGDSTFGSGEIAFRKIGKIGITVNKDTNPVDSSMLTNNNLVVMGQLAADSLTSGPGTIRAELETSSSLYPLFVGNPTVSTFMQNNPNNSPLTFTVTDHTRAPRLVIGSKTAPADKYNLYLAEGSNATNIGKNNSYCTLTADDLKNKGCPAMTYLGQAFPGTGTAVVAGCYDTTPVASPTSKGSCY